MTTKKNTKKKQAKKRKKQSEKSENTEHLDLVFVDYHRIQDPLKLQEFIHWIALPKKLRKPKTHKTLAKKIGVSQDTLTDWKKLNGFWQEVKCERDNYFREQTSEVLQGLYEKAKSGKASEVKLYLQYFEGFSEKFGIEEPPRRTLTEEERKEVDDVLNMWGLTQKNKKVGEVK